MSSNKMATKSDLQEMYQRILPYLGGSADAGFTPVGTVISVMSNHAPANYLICDGTVYNIADYPELANHFLNEFGSKNFFGGNGTTTFAVPDLRGEFLRGTGTNSHENQGSGANVGVHQDGTKHLRMQTANNSLYTAGSGVTSDLYDYRNNGSTQLYCKFTSGAAEGFEQTFTSRPTNTSVLFCIATKNIYLNPSNDYSTDEKVVGTWIDGKPLYQCTFSTVISQSEGATWKTIASVPSGIEIVSKNSLYMTAAGGFSNQNDGYVGSIATNSEMYTSVILKIENDTLKVFGKTLETTFYPIKYYVTLQYTKTTD